jgi:hypothetical protein
MLKDASLERQRPTVCHHNFEVYSQLLRSEFCQRYHRQARIYTDNMRSYSDKHD